MKQTSTPARSRKVSPVDIYTEALDSLLASDTGWSCCEIWAALQARGFEGDDCYKHPVYREYAELFSPEVNVPGQAWWLPADMDHEERREWRRNAMAFMLAIAEAA